MVRHTNTGSEGALDAPRGCCGWCSIGTGRHSLGTFSLTFAEGHDGERGPYRAQRRRWPTERDIVRMSGRSEEHTSELQSLMRISYAVFCLKKKKIRKHAISNTSETSERIECRHAAAK